jgi:hypothetical protein
MKKIAVAVLFLFLVSDVYSMSYAPYRMSILNKTNGKISVVAKPRGLGEVKLSTYTYLVDPPNVVVSVSLGLDYGTAENPLVLSPREAKEIFSYDSRVFHSGRPSKEGSVFNLTPGYEQFKMIYEDFLVLDEYGNKILGYETLTPAHFRGNADLVVD